MFVTTLGIHNFDCTKMNAHFDSTRLGIRPRDLGLLKVGPNISEKLGTNFRGVQIKRDWSLNAPCKDEFARNSFNFHVTAK